MTVKCLAPDVQNRIAEAFQLGICTIDELATVHGRSRRTIIRVLEDHNVDPGIKRRPGASKKVPTVQLELAPVDIEPTKTFRNKYLEAFQQQQKLDRDFCNARFGSLELPKRKQSWSIRALRAITNVLKRPFA